MAGRPSFLSSGLVADAAQSRQEGLEDSKIVELARAHLNLHQLTDGNKFQIGPEIASIQAALGYEKCLQLGFRQFVASGVELRHDIEKRFSHRLLAGAYTLLDCVQPFALGISWHRPGAFRPVGHVFV